jgi:hypothetical protein
MSNLVMGLQQPATTDATQIMRKFNDHCPTNRLMQSRYEENRLAPTQYLNVVTYDASSVARQPGKWLEWIHIKVTGGMQVCE